MQQRDGRGITCQAVIPKENTSVATDGNGSSASSGAMNNGVPRALETLLIDALMACARPKSASLTIEQSSERRMLPGLMSLQACELHAESRASATPHL